MARLTAVLCLGLAVFVPGLGLAQSAPAPAAAPAIPVTVAPVMRLDVAILLRNIGSVQAYQSALIRARVDGTLDSVNVEEGQFVRRGDVIAHIDPRPYQAAYDQALAKKASDEALLADARNLLAHARELLKTQAMAKETTDTRAAAVANLEATVRGDDANIAAAKVNLDYTNILAPFDGVMGLRQIDPGNVVRAADTTGVGIVTIAQVSPISVFFTLPQDALPRIQAAMATGKLPVFAFTPDDSTQLAEGRLLTYDNTVDPTTGSIKLKAVFPNDDRKLWPGQFVYARLQLGIQTKALTVPSVAVQRGPSGPFVYAVKPEDNTIVVKPVTLGQDDGSVAVVTKGLDDGMQVVVNGQSRLSNGSRVAATLAKTNS
jgi:multidrug efflux system membrane fusion protein